MIVAETFHGYDGGHRLLDSKGDISELEHSILAPLSDLSGPLPRGVDFDSYLSGFPCGRYYAVSRTWLDRKGTRAGTVATHTLLLDAQLAADADIFSLSHIHHEARPGAVGRVELPLDAEQLLALAYLWLTQPERPIVWVQPTTAEAAAAWVRAATWGTHRAQLSFSTFALGPRRVLSRPFDFLGCPPEAMGALHAASSRRAWWAVGTRQPSNAQGWARKWAENPVAARDECLGWCEQMGVPAPEPSRMGAFSRFTDLRGDGRLEVVSARVELLEILWPDLPPSHPLVVAESSALLDRIHEAPRSPRPLWAVRSLISRPIVQKRSSSDPEFSKAVVSVARAQLRDRIADELRAKLPDISSLLQDTNLGHDALSLLREAIRLEVDRTGPEPILDLVSAFLTSDDNRMFDVVLEACPARDRVGLLKKLEKREAHKAAQWASKLAVRVSDWTLASAAALMLEGESGALVRLSELASLHASNLEPLGELLRSMPAAQRLKWGLGEVRPALRELAERVGIQAVAELSADELDGVDIEALPDLSRAERLITCVELSQLADGSKRARALFTAIARWSTSAAESVLALLATADRTDLYTFGTWIDLNLLGSDQLGAAKIGARKLFRGATYRIIKALATGDMNVARALLDREPFRDAILARTLDRTHLDDLGDHGLRTVLECARTSWGDRESVRVTFVSQLLRAASRVQIEAAAPELISIFGSVSDSRARRRLAIAVTSAARRVAANSPQLVSTYFAAAHDAVSANDDDYMGTPRFVWEWDRARDWRRWLLMTWQQREWDVLGLIEIMNQDRQLCARLVRQAVEESELTPLVGQVREGAGSSPSLLEVIARALK